MATEEELPAGWAEIRLIDLGMPSTRKIEPSRFGDEVFELYSVPSYAVGTPDIVAGKTVRSAKQFVTPNDVLLCKIVPHLNRVWVVAATNGHRQIASSEWITIRAPEMSSKYLRYCLSEPTFRDRFLGEVSGVGGSLMRARTQGVSKLLIPIAPRPEQDRIAAKLDRVMERSAKAREDLHRVEALAGRYKRAVLVAAFSGELTAEWRLKNPGHSSKELVGRIIARPRKKCEAADWYPEISLPKGWEWVSVDQLAVRVQYGTSSKTDNDAAGVPVLRMGNIVDGKIDLRSLKYLPTDHSEFPELLLEAGDILFNRTNSAELVGKTAVYQDKPAKASFASYLVRVRVDGLKPELLSAYINSEYGREWVASVAIQQVGQANVNSTKLKQMAVPLMPEPEQEVLWQIIQSRFAAIDASVEQARRSLALLDRLEQQTLAKAFRGELVAQDPTDEPASVLLERIRSARGGESKPRGRGRRAKESHLEASQ